MKKVVASLAVLGMMLSFSTPGFAAAGSDRLLESESLKLGEHLVSPNGQYSLEMQYDGNLVLYGRGTHLWDTQTGGNYDVTEAMLLPYTGSSGGGRLAVLGTKYGYYLSENWFNRWYGNLLQLQDDGNLVLYYWDGEDYYEPVWDTGTYLR